MKVIDVVLDEPRPGQVLVWIERAGLCQSSPSVVGPHLQVRRASHFIRRFTKAYGAPPDEWRRCLAAATAIRERNGDG